MNKSIIGFFFFLFMFFSCSKEEKVDKLVMLSKVSEISDTLFLSQIGNLTVQNESLFFVDNYRGQVISLNEDLVLQKIIGNRGNGPDELAYLSEIFIHNDTIYALDAATGKLMLYDMDGRLAGKYRMPQDTKFMSEGLSRFLITSEQSICISTFSPKGAFVEQDLLTGAFEFWGERVPFDDEKQDAIRNDRLLFEVGSYFIAISDNMPIIEVYNQAKEKVSAYDFSHVETVKRRLSYLATQNLSSDSYGRICGDGYVCADKLYLLLMANGSEGFVENRIAVFSLFPQIKFESVLELPGEIYSTFCIGKHKIYAYNAVENQLEIFQK